MKLHTLQQHNMVLEETNQAVAITPATVSPQYLHNQTPMEFIISNFQEKKRKLMKCGTVHHFIPTTEATSSVSRVYPNGYGTGSRLLTFQYMLLL